MGYDHDMYCELVYLKSEVRRLKEELAVPVEKKLSRLELDLNLEVALRKAADNKIKRLEKIISILEMGLSDFANNWDDITASAANKWLQKVKEI